MTRRRSIRWRRAGTALVSSLETVRAPAFGPDSAGLAGVTGRWCTATTGQSARGTAQASQGQALYRSRIGVNSISVRGKPAKSSGKGDIRQSTGIMTKSSRARLFGEEGRGRVGATLSSGQRPISPGDVQTCMDVLDALLSDDRSRTAWLVGFLVGSALREETVHAP